ncbi:MAG: hybrid sensor histidine kinase/response regulator [bacterium JZ-2024 1]
MNNLLDFFYNLMGRSFLERQATINQIVLVFAGVVLVLLGYNVRLLRKLLSEFRQELNLSTMIARLIGAPSPQILTGDAVSDFLQAVADAIREGSRSAYVFSFRCSEAEARAAIIGASPETLITYFATDRLHRPLWKEDPLVFKASSPLARGLSSGQSFVVSDLAEFLEPGPSLNFLNALNKEWRIRKCFVGALVVGSRTVGGFICAPARRDFTVPQLAYLDRVRRLASVLLQSFLQREEQSAILEALTRKQERLRLLNLIAQAINASQDKKSLILGSLREVNHLYPDLPILILVPGDEPFSYRIAGFSPATSRFIPEALSHSLTFTFSRELHQELLNLPPHSFLRPSPPVLPPLLATLPSPTIFPISTGVQILGFCVVALSTASSLSAEDLEFFQYFTNHLALGIRNAEITKGLQDAYERLRVSQDAMTRQENLRVLGQMASAITHDINNLLTPIFAYLELSLSDPRLSPETRNYLTVAQGAAENIARVVQNMREFYREPPLKVAPVNIATLVQHALHLTEPRWKSLPQSTGAVVNVRTAIDPDLPLVLGSEPDLARALVNVIINAVEAMPRGGGLSIRAFRSPAHPSISTLDQPRDAICIEVRDEGVGMSQETLRRATEPFFTTKEETGSGLGLSIVRATMERHSGALEIESTPGKGTTVRLILPVSPPSSPPPETAPASQQIPVHERQRILVVDDDTAVLQGVSELLRKNGHTVFTAGSGAEALEIMSDIVHAGQNLDIVITDLGMPEMDGTTLASKVKSLSASTRVILLTGWGRSAESIPSLPQEISAVLQKPVRERELISAVASLSHPRGS